MARLLLAALLPLLACAQAEHAVSEAPIERADVVIYGATSGGIAAAIQARRMGRSVILLAPSGVVGGLTVSGLGATDIGNKAAIGGISREFYRRIRAHYAEPGSWVHERAEDFRGRGHRPGEDAAWTFEPKVASKVFAEMLAEVDVEPRLGVRLDRGPGGVVKNGTHIESIRDLDGRLYHGKVFLDASYEGDLLAAAGCSYHVGREANATYGETLNGVQTRNAVFHQFGREVDAYVVPGDPDSGLLPHVLPGPPEPDGTGDRRVQAYCFRLCTTDVAENRLPWPKPANYDEAEYEAMLREFDAGIDHAPWNPVWMPNRKTDTNNNKAFSTDALGMNWDYPEASYEERARIVAEHLRYTKGLLWTLANHPRVPEKVRAEFQRLGRARDEFVDSDHWPPHIYVREARRLVGELVMTEHHCRGTQVAPMSVGLGAYGMDSHNVQRTVTADGKVRNEGDVQVHGFSPYAIGYGAIQPRREEATNLLVPCAMSASHIAYGSIRMEPVFMVLGQSAATAACLTIEHGLGATQDLPYDVLEARLLADDQVLAWTGRVRKLVGVEGASLPGVVVDERELELGDGWLASSSNQPFVDYGYVHDSHARKGQLAATFRAELPADGTYEVRIAHSPGENRATNVPVVVRHAGGEARVVVNQRQAGPIGGLWTSLGEFRFTRAAGAVVVVSNAGTDGHVIVDAVQVVPVDGGR